MKFNIWEIIIIVIHLLALGIELADHGKPKEGNHNFITTLIANIVMLFLLYKAGLFRG